MEIAILLYDGVTALDAIGPYEVFNVTPGMSIKFVAVRQRRKAYRSRSLGVDGRL